MGKTDRQKPRASAPDAGRNELDALRNAESAVDAAWDAFCRALHKLNSPDSDELPDHVDLRRALDKARRVYLNPETSRDVLRTAWDVFRENGPDNAFARRDFAQAWRDLCQSWENLREPLSRLCARLPTGEDAVPYFLSRVAERYPKIGLVGAQKLTQAMWDLLGPKPRWDADRCELYFMGQMVRKYHRVKAKDLIRIIVSFDELGWPCRIDSPLTPSVNLREKVFELNRGITLMCFHSDGTGEGIAWSLRPD